MSDALVSVLTALADDELIIGHRHSEWTGFGPHIEEDVAFSSIAQDEIGHATAYYELVAAATGNEADALALGRQPDEYRHAIACERPNGNWAFSLARHWLYDHADALRLESLESSSHAPLAQLATKVRREERYHLMHADAWVKRIAQGPVEGRKRLVDSLAEAMADAAGLFEPYELEKEAVDEGMLPLPSDELRDRFLAATATRLDNLGLPTQVHPQDAERAEFIASSSGDLIASDETPATGGDGTAALGGRSGRHTKDFEELWEVMTSTYRGNPGARW